jgi:ABC-type glycerol-3-phosphate transport system substrate-binding protein
MSAKRQKKYRSELFRQELLGQIFSGELKVGGGIAPYRELSAKYDLSYLTVVNVIKKLCADGYLETRHGKGTTVKSANPAGEISGKSCRILIFEPVLSNQTWSSFLKGCPGLCDFYPRFVLHYKSLMEKENLDFHPDFIYTNDDLVRAMAGRGILKPLNDEIIKTAKIDLSLYEPKTMEMLSHKGKLYALPFGFSNLALFYNKDIFDSAGIEYPSPDWKWKDFLSAAEKLTVKEKNGRIRHYGFLSYFYINSMKSFYAQGFPGAFNLSEAFKTKKHLDGLRFMLELRRITPFVQSNEGFTGEIFLGGGSAMIISKYHMVKALSGCKFRWGVSHLPSGNRKFSACATQGIGINAEAPPGPETGNILRRLCGKEMQSAALQNSGLLPAYRDLAEKAPYSKAFLSQLPHTENLFLNSSENETAISSALYKMLTGLTLPEELIDELNKMRSNKESES